MKQTSAWDHHAPDAMRVGRGGHAFGDPQGLHEVDECVQQTFAIMRGRYDFADLLDAVQSTRHQLQTSVTPQRLAHLSSSRPGRWDTADDTSAGSLLVGSFIQAPARQSWWWSPTLLRINGYDPVQTDGGSMGDLDAVRIVHPSDRTRLAQMTGRAVRGDGIVECHYRILGPQQRPRPALTVARGFGAVGDRTVAGFVICSATD